jgi:hypothetical protein
MKVRSLSLTLTKCNHDTWWLTFVVGFRHSYRVVTIWTGETLYLVTVWCVRLSIFHLLPIIDDVFSARCARLSIAASIFRFLSASRDKLIGRIIIGLLLSMGTGLLFAKLYQCGKDLSWERDPLQAFCPQPWSLITARLLRKFQLSNSPVVS